MEILGTLYFAVTFSITGIMLILLAGYNVFGAVARRSCARLPGHGLVNLVFVLLFLPGGVVFALLGLVFWVALFQGWSA